MESNIDIFNRLLKQYSIIKIQLENFNRDDWYELWGELLKVKMQMIELIKN